MAYCINTKDGRRKQIAIFVKLHKVRDVAIVCQKKAGKVVKI